jgi:hypothetical protein
MTSYNPGTLFRIYNDSIHFTSLMTKDGKLLEIKNPNSKEKRLFNSLDEWCLSHNMSEKDVKIDTSKSSGIVIKDTNGFNYPKENHTAYVWVRWCYSIVSELAPQLLESNEFKIEYNKMVELCNKYKDKLYHNSYLFIGKNSYSPYNIDYNTKVGLYNKWIGYRGHFKDEWSNNSTFNEQRRNEILKVYKSIIDIITPLVKDKLETKHNILYAKYNIKRNEATNKRLQNKLNTIKKEIEHNELFIIEEKNKLVALEAKYASM